MQKLVKKLLAKTSNWRFILPVFLVFVFCLYLFQVYQADMSTIIGEETLIIDLRRDYTEPEITEFFTQLKEEGRALHQHVTGVVDMIFPFGYGILFILISAYLLKKITRPDSNWMYLALHPVLLMLVDFKENFTTLKMLNVFPNLTDEMVNSASQVTSLKSMCSNISLSITFVLVIIWIAKMVLSKTR